MSLEKVALRKADLTPEGQRARYEAELRAELEARRPRIRAEEIEMRIAASRPSHRCNSPAVSESDGLGPGSIWTCDEPTCKRQKVLAILPYGWGDTTRQWVWKNLPFNPVEDH